MITELKITNFRSLREVWLDNLQPVNLLIGPNNSGKSNILKALKFLGSALNGELPEKEQLEALFFQLFKFGVDQGSLLGPITFQFISDAFELNEKSNQIGFGGISIDHYTGGTFPPIGVVSAKLNEIPKDKISLADINFFDTHSEEFEAVYYSFMDRIIQPANKYNGGDHNPIDQDFVYEKHYNFRTYSNRAPSPLTGYFKTEIQRHIFAPFQNLKIYRPEPNKLLELYPIQNEQTMIEDGSNLVAFLDTMNRRNQKVFKKIIDDLQRFIPEFEHISFELVDTPLKELQEKYPNRSLAKIGLTDIYARVFWADSLSEGTLYFLSLLCIIHQPEPPKLLLLEEPEKGIHPRRIRETMDLIFELAAEKNIQVILTTHSTAVVDTFADIPEAVYIVERVAQQTIVKNLQRDVIEPHNEQFKAAGEEPIRFTDALGEHWAMGFLGGVPE